MGKAAEVSQERRGKTRWQTKVPLIFLIVYNLSITVAVLLCVLYIKGAVGHHSCKHLNEEVERTKVSIRMIVDDLNGIKKEVRKLDYIANTRLWLEKSKCSPT